MPDLVGFQTMVILDPYGINFDAVGVFGLDFQLLSKSGSSYCTVKAWTTNAQWRLKSNRFKMLGSFGKS